MPCFCHYDPPEIDKFKVKAYCKIIVKIIKQAEKIGDPVGLSLEDVKKLLDHLYTGHCDESKSKNEI